MKKLWISIVTVLMICNCADTFAQSNYEIHGGTAIPLSKFESIGYSLDGVRYSGYASIGVTAGFQYSYQFKTKNLGIFAGADLIYNSVNNEFKHHALEFYDELDDPVKKFPSYFNIPISVGLIYSLPISSNTKLLSKAGLTYNFVKSSDFVTQKYVYKYDFATNLGFVIGAGIEIREKILIQLNYFALGVHYETGSLILLSVPNEIEYQSGFSMNIQLLHITVGFEL